MIWPILYNNLIASYGLLFLLRTTIDRSTVSRNRRHSSHSLCGLIYVIVKSIHKLIQNTALRIEP